MNDHAFYGVCIHEAAHALAALRLLVREPRAAAPLERAIACRELVSVQDALGNGVTGVFGAVLGGRFYETGSRGGQPGIGGDSRARYAFLEAVKAFAGPVAELAVGEAQVPSSVDDVLVAEYGGERDLVHAYDALSHSDQLDRVHEARGAACRFVGGNWPPIAAVAAVLYERGEVCGEEIRSLSLRYRVRAVPPPSQP